MGCGSVAERRRFQGRAGTTAPRKDATQDLCTAWHGRTALPCCAADGAVHRQVSDHHHWPDLVVFVLVVRPTAPMARALEQSCRPTKRRHVLLLRRGLSGGCFRPTRFGIRSVGARQREGRAQHRWHGNVHEDLSSPQGLPLTRTPSSVLTIQRAPYPDESDKRARVLPNQTGEHRLAPATQGASMHGHSIGPRRWYQTGCVNSRRRCLARTSSDWYSTEPAPSCNNAARSRARRHTPLLSPARALADPPPPERSRRSGVQMG